MSHLSECALKGWHPGEVAIQNMMHLPGRVSITAVVNKLPEQHRLFHTTRLHFLPFTTLDDQGRPWASILTSRNGEPAFIKSPSSTTLEIQARVWVGEPTVKNLCDVRKAAKPHLVSGLGIEVSTRRRNKFAGSVSDASVSGQDMRLKLSINQALGLCPKYINVRKPIPHPDTAPRLIHETLAMSPGERLPEDVISFIHAADTAYLGTSYVARPEDEAMYPSHVGSNHRGGRPGFVRVRPTDGRTLAIDDEFLGNIHITPLAGLVFPSFVDGSILYVTGTAKTLFGAPARELMPLANVITTITVTGYVFIRNALPLREDPNEGPSAARTAHPSATWRRKNRPKLRMMTSPCLWCAAGFIMNFGYHNYGIFLRGKSHQLLDWTEDKSTENDDCVRTWTVSKPPTTEDPKIFSITVRKIAGGLITPILHRIIKNALASPGEIDLRSMDMTVKLRGMGESPRTRAHRRLRRRQTVALDRGGDWLNSLPQSHEVRLTACEAYFGLWDIALSYLHENQKS
ncbi:hypothetical protein BD779DRAFT_1669939 [Infundibulicybe gibba]|nr:hypothetical protein BD779DRAFT_1669939 [Infundibulicybe gibba]